MTRRASVAVGIPAYNEEHTIAKIVARASSHADKVVVVDDGSTDDTGLIAEKMGAFVVRHEKNMGKGAALRTLLAWSKRKQMDALVTLDADGQHNPDDIPLLLEPVLHGEADVVIGSRMQKPESMPKLRRGGQRTLDHLVGIRSTGIVVDSQSGFRAYSKRVINSIKVSEWGMGAETEILLKVRDSGFNIAQIPIDMHYERGRTTKLNPATHFSDVISTVIKKSVVDRPLRIVGIPGVLLLGLGIYGWLTILATYNVTSEFAAGHALVYTALSLIGISLLIAAITLFVVRITLQEVRGPQ